MAVAFATALAVTVKAVCGTKRGISGTRRRPSMLHSEELFGPDILGNIRQVNARLKSNWSLSEPQTARTFVHSLVGDGGESLIVYSPSHLCAMTLC